jgi:hypothetical protein
MIKSPKEKALNVSKKTMAILKGARDFRSAYKRDEAKVQKKMGGGMMQKPMGGYTSGGSVTVKTKIGKYFPTKTY